MPISSISLRSSGQRWYSSSATRLLLPSTVAFGVRRKTSQTLSPPPSAVGEPSDCAAAVEALEIRRVRVRARSRKRPRRKTLRHGCSQRRHPSVDQKSASIERAHLVVLFGDHLFQLHGPEQTRLQERRIGFVWLVVGERVSLLYSGLLVPNHPVGPEIRDFDF